MLRITIWIDDVVNQLVNSSQVASLNVVTVQFV